MAWLASVLVHHSGEFFKQVEGVVRAGRGFRMILDAKERLAPMPEAFKSLVVQVEVGEFHFARGKGIRIDTEAVILGGDFHPVAELVQNRMVAAAMPELASIRSTPTIY